MASDVLSISAGGFPGSGAALAHLAAATGTTRHMAIRGRGNRGPEHTFVRELIRDTPPTLLILGGWSGAYDSIVDLAARQRVPVAVYWTSTAGQSEIGREMAVLDRVMNDARIRFRWFAHRSLGQLLEVVRDDCAWIPNLLAPRLAMRRPSEARQRRSREAQISLFCSPHEYHRKNILNSLAAVSRIGAPYRLHLNGLSSQPEYRAWLERLGIHYLDHGWMSRETYETTLHTLDLGLQVSFAESFNYVTADHLLAGVPVVASAMVSCLAWLPARATRGFIVSQPDDPIEIARVITRLLAHAATARRHAAIASAALRAMSAKHLTLVRRALRDACERR